ncbi:MAG: thiamine pyrophosphate-binding protein [Bdellovibrionales bacterium]|nr:thiamine pyrophosphate-binding protein [Bdellovibrionales bacterium]
MRKTKAHEIVDLLAEHGITHVIGIPGTHNIELYDAMAEHPSITPVLITDEQSAGFMGDGYARSSGRMAALSLVPGAGLSHAVSGIAEAYLDQIPLLVLACGIRGDSGKKFQLHDIDQIAMVKPVCKWATSIQDWNRVDEIMKAAIRIAKEAPQGPVVIEMPAEGLLLSDPPNREQGAIPKSPELTTHLSDSQKMTARGLIAGAKRIGIYVGNIGWNKSAAGEKLVQLAHHLDAWVWSTITAKGLYPENEERFIWNVLGAGAPEAHQEIEAQVDLWIAMGARFGEVATASYGFNTKKPIIHVDVDPSVLKANLDEALSIPMDAWDFVEFLMKEIPARQAGDSIQIVRQARMKYEKQRDREPETHGKISPRRLMKAVQAVFPKDTVYAFDSGNGLFLGMENLRIDKPGCFLAPVDYSCMGYSIPAAVGAKVADPERPVVVFPGDGAFLMTGLELLTGRMYGAAPLVMVLRDGELSQISQFQKGSVVRTTLTELPPYDLSKIADAAGYEFRFMSSDSDLEAFLVKALEETQNGTPVLVEVPIDYAQKTAFTRGVVMTNFKRFSFKDKLSLAGRVLVRKTHEQLQKI